MKDIPMLSKSRFLAGLQCHLRLWFQCYARDLAAEVSPAQQAVFDSGHEVGELATRLYPDGVSIKEDYLHHKEAVRSTLEAMQNPDVKAIYEAAFFCDDVRVRVDILERTGNESWNLVEVKSSTKVKDVYYPDVAVQYYVLEGCGLKINRAGILHINNQYVYDGIRLDLRALFAFKDLTEHIKAMLPEMPDGLAALKTMLANSEAPKVIPSRHCSRPYNCEFWDHCTQDMPEFWVFNINGIAQARLDELARLGVAKIPDIPDSFPLSEIQNRIRISVIHQQHFISDELEAELNKMQYPIHFLDFETVAPAVPRYAGTRPYQTIPFQWSDHIRYQDGRLAHREYLCSEDKDPREEFIQTLLKALGTDGSIVIYTVYETAVLNSLIAHLPRYTDALKSVIERFIDLHAIIRNNYYHPKFYGSFSLKSVLPALLPEMSYAKLAIQDGIQATLGYLRMIDPSTLSEEKERIRKNLLTYCGQDTLAMVKIREVLLKQIYKPSQKSILNEQAT
jgi:predicted RecB family nuclease